MHLQLEMLFIFHVKSIRWYLHLLKTGAQQFVVFA